MQGIGAHLALVAAQNTFGLELFRRLVSNESGNVFISPFSIATALSMMSCGAVDATLEEMRTTLWHELIGDEEAVKEAFHNLSNHLSKADPQVKFLIANSAWPAKEVNEEFVDAVKQAFNAEVIPHPTVRAVNGWCSEKTQGFIKEIIQELPADLAILLVNAIYFKGSWASRFNSSLTQRATFHNDSRRSGTVQMMRQVAEFSYLQNDQFQMVRLDYGEGGQFAASVLLPRTVDGVDKLVSALTPDNWSEWSEAVRETQVDLYLPRMKVSYGVKSLVRDLQSQGMQAAFRGGFDRIAPNTLISDVLHKAVMEVDEEGTTAAAVTAVLAMCPSLPPQPVEMKVDHPFLFVISNKQTNQIIFVGKIVEP